jgi:hypothetical protein
LIKAISIFIGLIALIGFKTNGFAQSFTLEIQIKNQPENHVVIGKIRGDDFEPKDTLLLENKATSPDSKIAEFTFPEESQKGIYRLVLGQTTYAKVMNEPAQHLDFIFNNEDLIFETDFNAPEDKVLVVLSEENRIWFAFQWEEKKLQKKLKEAAAEVNYYQDRKSDTTNTDKALKNSIDKYNALQKQRNGLITEIVEHNSNLLAAKIIKLYSEPFLDGNLTQRQRKEKFQNEFFKSLDFTDENLINSSVYSDRIFYYLTSYNHAGLTKEQLENEYIKAVDIILPNIKQNPKVYKFILDYMIHGFEVLKMDKVIDYIAEKK